ncbi:MAG: HlyD family efflux transporter periplasmic adaptor subunit, partial [Clostridia bacterium]|nr:HlyD family efflux transporter periplasmic adaptor subunit [Clostridia bacterium]
SGIILEAGSFSKGDTVNEGTEICMLVDNTKLRVSSYFSYTYEDSIKVGQEMTVSIPSMMMSVSGKVEEIYKVKRISQEGSVLFEVVTAIENPGILTEGMKATAISKTKSGEIIAPYEDSVLEYYRKTQILSTAKGPVEYCSIRNYNAVKAGDVLLKLGEKDIDAEAASLNALLKTAYESLDAADEELNKLNATAPISGTVISLGIFQGEKAQAGTVAVSIADLQTMIVNIMIDEKDISYVKAGMTAFIDQWGTSTIGTIESVSLSGQFENGVSYFPGVISIDNYDGSLMTGSYISWSVSGNQSENCLILPIQSVKYVETPEGPKTVVFIESDRMPENTVEVISSLEEIPDGFYPVPVTTGISDNYNVEIIDGVSEGDTVFTQMRKQSTWQ